MESRFYTEVTWRIELDRKHTANHRLLLRLFNVSRRLPAAQESISIELPSEGGFRDFKTKVGEDYLQNGYGLRLRGNEQSYVLDIIDVNDKLGEEDNIDVEVQFKQPGAVRTIKHINFIDLTFISHFYCSTIDLTIVLPRITSRWQQRFRSAIARLRKKPGIYEIEAIRMLPTEVDQKKGEIAYRYLRDTFPPFGLAFVLVGGVDLVSILIGIILGVIVELTVQGILRLLRWKT